MKTVLLALSATRQAARAVDYALSLASSEGAQLIVCYVLEPEVSEALSDRLTDIDFVGERPSDELADAVLGEHEKQASDTMGQIEDQARIESVPCKIFLRKGHFAEECLRVIAEHGVGLTVLTRERKSGISRFLFGSEVDKLIKSTDCDVMVIQ